VFVKIGQDFQLEVPPAFTLEKINFDFIDSIIDKTEDPGNEINQDFTPIIFKLTLIK